MKNIVKYNSILVKYIIVFSLLVILAIISYKLHKPLIRNKRENFSQISLEKQVILYDVYRNYIDGKEYLMSKFRKGREIPYTIDKKCFQKEYSRCIDKHKPYAIADPLNCQDSSFDSCYL